MIDISTCIEVRNIQFTESEFKLKGAISALFGVKYIYLKIMGTFFYLFYISVQLTLSAGFSINVAINTV